MNKKEKCDMSKGMISILSALAGTVIGTVITSVKLTNIIDKTQKMSDKHFTLFLMMNQWVRVKQKGKSVVSFFEKNSYKRIAIYGMSYAGETLLEELGNSEIKVVYGIDRNIDTIYADIKIVKPNDELEDVDAIVITPIFFINEIRELLSQKVTCPILSLEDILYEL